MSKRKRAESDGKDPADGSSQSGAESKQENSKDKKKANAKKKTPGAKSSQKGGGRGRKQATNDEATLAEFDPDAGAEEMALFGAPEGSPLFDAKEKADKPAAKKRPRKSRVAPTLGPMKLDEEEQELEQEKQPQETQPKAAATGPAQQAAAGGAGGSDSASSSAAVTSGKTQPPQLQTTTASEEDQQLEVKVGNLWAVHLRGSGQDVYAIGQRSVHALSNIKGLATICFAISGALASKTETELQNKATRKLYQQLLGHQYKIMKQSEDSFASAVQRRRYCRSVSNGRADVRKTTTSQRENNTCMLLFY